MASGRRVLKLPEAVIPWALWSVLPSDGRRSGALGAVEAKDMAIAMLMRWAGVTPDQYDRAKELIGWEDNPAPGGLFHLAGFDEHGLHCADVWETSEAFQAFVTERLMPGVQQVGIQGQPEVELVPLHDLFTPGFAPRGS